MFFRNVALQNIKRVNITMKLTVITNSYQGYTVNVLVIYLEHGQFKSIQEEAKKIKEYEHKIDGLKNRSSYQ